MKALPVRAATLAAGLAACLSSNPIAQTGWSELRGTHFVLRGQLNARSLTPIACDVEEAARVVGVPRANTFNASESLSIIATGNERGVRELLPQFWERRGPRPVGAYWAGLYGHHVVVRVDARQEERFRRILHELAHFATHVAHPNPPIWLDEGMSEIWEHAAIEAGQIEIGQRVPGHVRLLRSDKNWIPIGDLLAAPSVPGSHSDASAFYAQSWALVHYLLFEKGSGKFVFDQLLATHALPTDEELRRYARGTLARSIKLATTAHTGDCGRIGEVRAVSHAESLLVKARALADGERPAAALPLLAEALRRDPGNAATLETLGFVHFARNSPRESAAVFDQIISGGQGSHVAYYYRAVLAASVPDLSDGSGQVPVLEYLRAAIRLSPGFLPARERLGDLLKKEPVAPGLLPVPD